MAFAKPGKAEMLLVLGTLVAGAVIFSFPFIWMTVTSFKTQREMEAGRLRILPTSPRPQEVSPYIDTMEFYPPERPEGIPARVWEALLPRLDERLGEAVDAWEPRIYRSAATSAAPAPVDPTDYRNEMIKGMHDYLSTRISDEARHSAERFERAVRRDGNVSQREIIESLGDGAVEAGVETILSEVGRIVDEDLMSQVFDAAYRRIALADVRIRTRNFRLHSLYTGSEWEVVSGSASLATVREHDVPSQEIRVHFPSKMPRATFRFVPQPSILSPEGEMPIPIEEIDRVYIAVRGDASWARVVYEVVHRGRLYRTRAIENLGHITWFERQLRWPQDHDRDASQRPYRILYPAGAAPEGSSPFEVRVHIQKISPLGAWAAKLTNNYRLMFQEVPYGRYLATSFALTLLNIVLVIFSSTLVAYAFARLQWPGRDFCFIILLATMMIPPQVTMIPGFLVIRWLGWYNTLRPLWVPAAFGVPFFIFLLRQFLKNIPKELEDSARIDGCGFLRIYWHVMLPLVKPTIAVIAIYTFMAVWNNFMGPLIYVNDERLFPLALGLFKLQIRSGADMGLMMAGSFLMTLPVLILFFFLQRYFIQGVSLTGIKG